MVSALTHFTDGVASDQRATSAIEFCDNFLRLNNDVVSRHHVQDVKNVVDDMVKFNEMAEDNRRTVVDFRDDIEKIVTDFKREATKSADDMRKVLKLNTVFQKQMDVMNSRLDEFPVIRSEAKMIQSAMDAVNERLLSQKDEFNEFEKKSVTTCNDLDLKSNNLQLKLNELKNYISKLTDEIEVPSNRITVASAAGFADKSVTLMDVLKICHENIR